MGINYYVETQPPCDHCGRAFPVIHIGKSSAGWCFGLHVYDDGILPATWREWQSFVKDRVIRNEYREVVTENDLTDVVTKREWKGGLQRHVIDGRFCIGHGEGTYDLLFGEFS
jgi:hypothetical protein